jgi:hypothetical protein
VLWPPLRLAQVRCERESVGVVLARRFLDDANVEREVRWSTLTPASTMTGLALVRR